MTVTRVTTKAPLQLRLSSETVTSDNEESQRASAVVAASGAVAAIGRRGDVCFGQWL